MPARLKPVEDLVCRRPSRDRSLRVAVPAIDLPIPEPPLGCSPPPSRNGARSEQLEQTVGLADLAARLTD